jgi:hypothetical protein
MGSAEDETEIAEIAEYFQELSNDESRRNDIAFPWFRAEAIFNTATVLVGMTATKNFLRPSASTLSQAAGVYVLGCIAWSAAAATASGAFCCVWEELSLWACNHASIVHFDSSAIATQNQQHGENGTRVERIWRDYTYEWHSQLIGVWCDPFIEYCIEGEMMQIRYANTNESSEVYEAWEAAFSTALVEGTVRLTDVSYTVFSYLKLGALARLSADAELSWATCQTYDWGPTVMHGWESDDGVFSFHKGTLQLHASLLVATRLPGFVCQSELEEVLHGGAKGFDRDRGFENFGLNEPLGVWLAQAASATGDLDQALVHSRRALTMHQNPVKLFHAVLGVALCGAKGRQKK